jgi:hypothetical protein
VNLPGFPRLIYSLVALWGIILGIVFVLGLVDPRQLPWSTEFLGLLENADMQRLLSIFTRFIGGLLLGIGLVVFSIILLPNLHSPQRANVVAFTLCLTILIPQLATWIQLGLPITRVLLQSSVIVLVIISFLVGRKTAGVHESDA